MKKEFVKISIFSLLAFGLIAPLQSCDDYDDDIANVEAVNDDQAKQIATLESALKSAQDAATAAGQKAEAAQQAADAAAKAAADAAAKGDQALAEAQNAVAASQAAQAAAAAAEKAAAEAKSEAIAAALDAVKQAIADANLPSQETLNKLATQIAAIETNLSTLGGEVDAAQAAINQLEIQVAALNKYKEQIEQLPQLIKDLGDLEGSVEAIETTIASIKAEQTKLATQVGKNTQDIETINATLNAISGQVADIQPAVLTLISHRLTSVTLMPSLYVDGIPTIEFLSAKYTAVGTTQQFIVSNGKNEVEYRLNPSGVKSTDIQLNNLSFVTRTATSRAAEAEIINVASASVDNGVLTILADKSNTKSLNLAGDQIYTVALRVPIDQALWAENESDPCVYSEYSRVSEEYFTPLLHSNTDKELGKEVPSSLAFFSDKKDIYAAGFDASQSSSMISVEIAYNETLDLDEVVAGWYDFNSTSRADRLMSHEAMEAYGFDVLYEVATDEYLSTAEDKANQQKYAKIDGSILTPVTPSGLTNNQAIIGKQPIIKATLYDTVNKKAAAVKYLKVHFTAVKRAAQEFTIPGFEGKVNCDDIVNVVDWNLFTTYVLEQFNNGEGQPAGLSKEDFANIYTSWNVVCTPNVGDVTPKVVIGGTESVPVITWTLTQTEVGHINFGATKTFTAKITFKDANAVYPEVIVNLSLVVTNDASNKLDASNIGKVDDLKWNGDVMKVVPVPMAIPYDGTSTAEYNTNILEGRYNPYVTGLLSCATYDIDFAKSLVSQYNGSSLTYSQLGHWQMTSTNQSSLTEILFAISNDTNGKNLVDNEKKIQLDWSTNINGEDFNDYVFYSNYLQIVKPLKFEAAYTGAGFVDDSKSQQVSLTNPTMWSITDCYGNNVSNLVDGLPTDYWNYYAVEGPEIVDDVVISDTNTGNGSNLREPETVNMSANFDAASGMLTFQNNGAAISKDAYLRVPVKFTHKWSNNPVTLYVFVPLKHKI